MLARADSSAASVGRMRPIPATDRMRQIRSYVVRRLRDEVRGRHGAQARLAREFRMSTAHLSNVLSDNPTREPGEEFVHLAASHWGMTYAELEAAATGSSGPASSPATPAADPPIATFLMKLDRMPGLRRWIEDTRSILTVSQIAAGMAAYDETPPRGTEGGVPLHGWDAWFRDVLAGRMDASDQKGDAQAAEALEFAALKPSLRKRIAAAEDRKRRAR